MRPAFLHELRRQAPVAAVLLAVLAGGPIARGEPWPEVAAELATYVVLVVLACVGVAAALARWRRAD